MSLIGIEYTREELITQLSEPYERKDLEIADNIELIEFFEDQLLN